MDVGEPVQALGDLGTVRGEALAPDRERLAMMFHRVHPPAGALLGDGELKQTLGHTGMSLLQQHAALGKRTFQQGDRLGVGPALLPESPQVEETGGDVLVAGSEPPLPSLQLQGRQRIGLVPFAGSFERVHRAVQAVGSRQFDP